MSKRQEAPTESPIECRSIIGAWIDESKTYVMPVKAVSFNITTCAIKLPEAK